MYILMELLYLCNSSLIFNSSYVERNYYLYKIYSALTQGKVIITEDDIGQ